MYYSFRTKKGNSFRTKSSKYKDYLDNIQSVLYNMLSSESDFIKYLTQAKDDFIPELYILITIPKKDWVTLKGKLKTHDASNFIKPTEDAFFKFIKEYLKLDMDDNQVLKVISEKQLSEDSLWSVTLVVHFTKEPELTFEYHYEIKEME
jgi:hypothetical protein